MPTTWKCVRKGQLPGVRCWKLLWRSENMMKKIPLLRSHVWPYALQLQQSVHQGPGRPGHLRLTEDLKQGWGLALLSRPPEGRWDLWLMEGLYGLGRKPKEVCEFHRNGRLLPSLALETSIMSSGCAFPISRCLPT